MHAPERRLLSTCFAASHLRTDLNIEVSRATPAMDPLVVGVTQQKGWPINRGSNGSDREEEDTRRNGGEPSQH